MKLLFEGPVLSYSGYGVHCRQIFSWLYDNLESFDCIINEWGQSNWIVSEDIENEILKKLKSEKVNIVNQHTAQKNEYDYYIRLSTPVEFVKKAKYNIGITAGLETDICGKKIIDYCNVMDYIIVPSSFAKDTLINTAKKNGIELIPNIDVIHEYFPENWSKEVKNDFKLDIDIELNKVKTDFNFLLIGQIAVLTQYERKNILNSILTWVKAFKDNEKVGLIVKTNLSNHSKENNSRLLGELGNIFKDIPLSAKKRIHLINGRLDEHEMYKLYTHKKVSCLFNLAYAEGFCLPALEAASVGLPVIISSWSGHCDFMDLTGKRIKFNHKIDYVQKDWLKCWGGNFVDMFIEESRWAYPDYDDVVKKFQKFYEQNSMPRQWALELKDKIHEKFSKQNIEKDYNEKLKFLLMKE